MFRLRKVLEWKEAEEKRARAERLGLEQRAAELRQAGERMAAVRASFPDTAADPELLSDWSAWGEGLRERERGLHRRLEAMRPELEEKAREHGRLRQEVEGLRKLRERAAARHRRALEKKTQEVIDDVASRRKLPGPGREFLSGPGGAPASRGDHVPEDRDGGASGRNRGTGT